MVYIPSGMDIEGMKKILISKQGELEEDLRVMGGKKAEDLSKEEVFSWMKWKAQWELVTELISKI